MPSQSTSAPFYIGFIAIIFWTIGVMMVHYIFKCIYRCHGTLLPRSNKVSPLALSRTIQIKSMSNIETAAPQDNVAMSRDVCDRLWTRDYRLLQYLSQAVDAKLWSKLQAGKQESLDNREILPSFWEGKTDQIWIWRSMMFYKNGSPYPPSDGAGCSVALLA